MTSCQNEVFEIEEQAESYFYIKNEDYLIPTLVRGNTKSKKVLLFVQEGPGSSSLDFAKIDYPNWQNTLEKDYAVAYYNQRGTGNMQGNFSQGESVVQTWIKDLHAVATFLKAAYKAELGCSIKLKKFLNFLYII